MAKPLRCRMTGCDLDPCGVCRRCDTEQDAHHTWKDAERERPCYGKEVCETCEREREKPDHDWTPGVNALGETSLKCSRCNLEI